LASSLTLTATRVAAQIWSPSGFDPSRFAELSGARDTTGQPPPGLRRSFVFPTLYLVNNSAIPYSINDGALWAGRGNNTSLTVGGELTYRTPRFLVEASLAPTIVASENRPFQFYPNVSDPTRSAFASPFHNSTQPMDLPLRFGDVSFTEVNTGESYFRLTDGAVRVGVSSAQEWWGPGIRNSLIMSDNAAGIPRAFVETSHPLRTRIGDVTARLILGTLTESRFFDTLSVDDYRSINGLLVTLKPRFDTTLTLGFSRVVYEQSGGMFPSPLRSLDVVRKWDRRASKPDDGPQHLDQIFSLSARWLFPTPMVEVYAEWARMEIPRSFREFLIAPENSQAYTLGLQSARQAFRANHFVRLQAEVSDLDQLTVFSDRPEPDFYAGQVTAQGYTQRGQVVGAGIGPGGSSQFVALDYITPRWQGGLFAGRTRWEEDALFRNSPRSTRHDVTIFSGARGSVRAMGLRFTSEMTVGRRLNYLFQNDNYNPGEQPRSAVDIHNITLEFQLSR
jgi:hypothetical protein